MELAAAGFGSFIGNQSRAECSDQGSVAIEGVLGENPLDASLV